MAKKKALLSSAPPLGPGSPSEHHSVSVRAIENGHIVRHSSHGTDGSYSEKEFYSKTRPQIGMSLGLDAEPEAAQSSNRLKRATQLLNSRRT